MKTQHNILHSKSPEEVLEQHARYLNDVLTVPYSGLLPPVLRRHHDIRNPKTGMIAHGCILVVLLLHSTIAENRYFSNLYASLSIIPLIRILSLCTPLMHFEYISWFLIVGVPLFAAIFTCMYIQHLDLRSVGLKIPSRKDIPLTGGLILLGMPVGFVEYYILEPEFMIGAHVSWIVPILILVICTGFLEELLFRGLLQHTFAEAVGIRGDLDSLYVERLNTSRTVVKFQA